MRPTGNAVIDAAKQAIDIIRRRTGRDNFPLPGNWMPHVLYTHLVLNDYLAQRLPNRMVVSPEDEHRLNWQIDPQNQHDQGVWQPFQNPESGRVGAEDRRWAYSGTYQAVPASYDSGQSRWSNPRAPAVNQHRLNHNEYNSTGVRKFGNLRMSSVAFPASKVHVMDDVGRHSGRQDIYYGYPEAKTVMHMFDGSATFRSSSEANLGWIPTRRANTQATEFTYFPRTWEPRPLSGTARERVKGYHRWTRGGIQGVDFDNHEIDTGQMN